MATVRIEYFGMEGEGRTVTEAKQDAGRKIEAALSGSYTPEVLAWRGNGMLVYREPVGWYAVMIADTERGIIARTAYGCLYGSKKEATARAQSHLAQLGWTEADGETAPDFLTSREQLADFRSWVRFQLRACEGRRRGIPKEDLHDYACMNPYRPEVWQDAAQANANSGQ